MNIINVLIADDEPIARDILISYCSRIPSLHIAAVCKNAQEAMNTLEQSNIDLLLLDINMPEITGIDMLKIINNPPPVILTTAYPDYAVESYELNTIDYLLKPFSFDRFSKAINKAVDTIDTKPATDTAPERFLFVRSDGKQIRINTSELSFIEADKDYVRLHMPGKPLLVLSTMKNMEELLESFPAFVRVHKSYIINIAHITAFDSSNLTVNGQQISIGGTYKERFAELMNAFRHN